jgi:catechol 2,3-dioxygenase-like lactoylglutathione lyase family enzyme
MSYVFDHVHLSAPDQAEAGRWYVRYLGARPGASPERVLVGDRQWLIFYRDPGARPSREGVIDRLGFSVPNVARAAADILSGGGLVVVPPHEEGPTPTATIDDPWGVRIALVEDTAASGLHHVHLTVPEPAAAFAWYVETFGGERARLSGRFDGIRYGSVWLLADAGQAAPSAGHAIDHVAWRTLQLDAAAVALKGKGVPFTMEPRDFNPATRISFVEGPAGTRIEVLERR